MSLDSLASPNQSHTSMAYVRARQTASRYLRHEPQDKPPDRERQETTPRQQPKISFPGQRPETITQIHAVDRG